MPEQRVPITEEEQNFRNKLLRGKRRGMRLALAMVALAAGAIIYLLQSQEIISDQFLLQVTMVETIILLLAALMYRHFASKIAKDMQSHEKIVTAGYIVRFMRDLRTGQQSITLDIDGRWMTLSIAQLRRLVPDVIELNHLLLRDRFELEFTPYGHHLMRATRLS